jgi:hypothetical protein
VEWEGAVRVAFVDCDKRALGFFLTDPRHKPVNLPLLAALCQLVKTLTTMKELRQLILIHIAVFELE